MPNRKKLQAGFTGDRGFFPAGAPFQPRFLLRAVAVLLGSSAFAILLASGKMRCSFARLFHAPCPSCGTTRAVHALLRFDFLGALRLNPLAPFVTGSLFAIGLWAVYVTARDGNIERIGEKPVGSAILKTLVASLVVQIVVWALRFAGLFGGPVPV